MTAPTQTPPGAASEREGLSDWLVALTSTAGVTVSVIHIYSMGVFILPIEQELGWSRAQISGALTVVSVLSVVLAPFVGILIDRIGSRRIAITGIAAYSGSLALLATIGTSVWHWWATWIAVGLSSVMIKPTVWMAAIAGRFRKRRGLAIALALCGTGIGSAAMPVVTNWLLLEGSWRAAYLTLGIAAAVITLPLVVLFFRDPPSLARRRASGGQLPGLSMREGLRSSRFGRMAIASFLVYVAIIGLSVHFVPILVSLSIPRGTAAMVAGTIGIASICGRLLTGFLLDRLPGALIGGISFALPIVACILLLMFDGSVASATLIAAVIGVSLGAETDVTAYLSSRYFGLRNYGLLFGTIAGLLSLGAGVGPMIAGLIFDHFGSYRVLIWGLIPAFAVGGALIGSLGAYPSFDAEPAE